MPLSGLTGTNNIPLSSTRRFGQQDSKSKQGAIPEEGSNHFHKSGSRPPVTPEEDNRSRGRSPTVSARKRKRGSRWGDPADTNSVAGLMGLPTTINSQMTNEQLEAYCIHLRILEITQKIKINDFVPSERIRSPSPPPQYDSHGRRTNTREFRYRKKLEAERHELIQKASKIFPNYQVPADYRRPLKTHEKVYIPVNDYPEINFIGLLIGPRGNTLKEMEAKSKAKIAIRGKGSVKEGKGASDRATDSNLDEDLHCLIISDNEEHVAMAKRLIHEIIETAASVPEQDNNLKRHQLRLLATLNGTLRDDENQACQNCGQIGHRKYDCPEKKNYVSSVICRVCGNAGHFARDCMDRARGSDWGSGTKVHGDIVDREYESLMQELGGQEATKAINSHRPRGLIADGNQESGCGNSDGSKSWDAHPSGRPAPWHRPSRNSDYGNNGDGNTSRWEESSIPWRRQQDQKPHNPVDNYTTHGNQDCRSHPWEQPRNSDLTPSPMANNNVMGGYQQNHMAPQYGGYYQQQGALPSPAPGPFPLPPGVPPPAPGSFSLSPGVPPPSPPPPPPPCIDYDMPPPPPPNDGDDRHGSKRARYTKWR